MRRAISTEALELIDLIDKTGSLVAAAQALFKVPSAITYTIKKLEDDLGVKLFIKDGRRLKMTAAGNVLLEQGRHLLDNLNTLEKMVIEADTGWEPKINIVINTILSVDFILPSLKRFMSARPHTEVNVYEKSLSSVWDSLLSDNADLVIGASGIPPQSSDISYNHIQKIDWHFSVCCEHELAKIRHPLKMRDLEKYRFIVLRDPKASVRVFSKLPTLSVPTMSDKIHAISHGLGVGFLPSNRTKPLKKNKTIKILALEKTIEQTDLYLAWKTKNQGKALNWLIADLLSKNSA